MVEDKRGLFIRNIFKNWPHKMRPDKNVKCVLEFKEEEVIGVRAAKEAEHVGPYIALVAPHHLIWNQKFPHPSLFR